MKLILSGAIPSAWPAIAWPTRSTDINRAGVRLAREAAKSFDVWVAGSVGPLGTRIEPLGKTSFQEARDAFRQQIRVLAESGVDLLILETFGYLEEIHQALLAAKEVAPSLPIVAQVTIDEDGNCLDGSDPGTFVAKLEEWGADVIGCNCSVGPVAMLDAMERVRAATSLPLAAQPNAGIPRSVEGRISIYARLSTWRAMPGSLSPPECGWSADAAEPRPNIFG